MDTDNGGTSKKTVFEKRVFFGWLKRTTNDAGHSWYDYIGPPRKFCLWLAIAFISSSSSRSRPNISINGQNVWWDLKTGFWGSGIKELDKLRRQSK